MLYNTYKEFKTAVYSWLKQGNYDYAADTILAQHKMIEKMKTAPESGGVPTNWVEWAKRVRNGKVHAPAPAPAPALRDGGLFGEPITTKRRGRR